MQKGQAIIEAMVLMLVLATLLVALMWLGRLQDIGLQLSHASRHNAFKFAYQKIDVMSANDMASYIQNSFWKNRNASNLINTTDFSIKDTQLSSYINTDKKFITAIKLFDELELDDKTIWQSMAAAEVGTLNKNFANLAKFDQQKLHIMRFTAIMRSSPTVSNDTEVQSRLANSPSVWANQAKHSINLGQKLNHRLQNIDSAWNRSLPEWDWLNGWVSSVPKRHLRTGGDL